MAVISDAYSEKTTSTIPALTRYQVKPTWYLKEKPMSNREEYFVCLLWAVVCWLGYKLLYGFSLLVRKRHLNYIPCHLHKDYRLIWRDVDRIKKGDYSLVCWKTRSSPCWMNHSRYRSFPEGGIGFTHVVTHKKSVFLETSKNSEMSRELRIARHLHK